MIVYSFALGKNEPNPCNVRLAREAERTIKESKEKICFVAQWEVARALGYHDPVGLVVHPTAGKYLDSEEVTRRAAEFFRGKGITEVIPVAQWLQMFKCKQLIEQAGLTVVSRRVGRIGFYKDSVQWWTRGPLRLVVYAVLQKFTGRHGQ